MIYGKLKTDKWVDLDSKIRIKVDYPNMEQGMKLDEMYHDSVIKEGYYELLKEPVPADYQENKEQYNSLGLVEMKGRYYQFHATEYDSLKQIKYTREYIRFTIKAWEGIDDVCELETSLGGGTQLKQEQWWNLVWNADQAYFISRKIADVLGFDEDDKKKLDSASGSETTDTQKETDSTIH